jgi:DNA-binding response OmpR family regulator
VRILIVENDSLLSRGSADALRRWTCVPACAASLAEANAALQNKAAVSKQRAPRIGLSLVARILEVHHAQIALEDERRGVVYAWKSVFR